MAVRTSVSEDVQRTADAAGTLVKHLEVAGGEELGGVDFDVQGVAVPRLLEDR